MRKNQTDTSIFWLSVLAFIFAWALFIQTAWGGDNEAHIRFAQEALSTGHYPPHFLYQVLLNTLTLFSGHTMALRQVSAILLGLAVSLKIMLSLQIIHFLFSRHGRSLDTRTAAGFAAVLFLAGPVINWWQFPMIYKGQFTPNIWHNPTSVLLMPFALGVIRLMIEPREARETRTALAAALLLALSVLIKPNFALVMIPAALVMLALRQFGFRETLILIIPAILLLGWQFLQNYTPEGGQTMAHYKSSIAFNPLVVLKSWTGTVYGSLAVSFAFPAGFIYCFYKDIKNKDFFFLGLTLTAVSMALFLLFSETGDKMRHGNFFWGTVPALYLLFVSCASELYLVAASGEARKRKAEILFCCELLILHVIGGAMFYVRTMLGNSFYA